MAVACELLLYVYNIFFACTAKTKRLKAAQGSHLDVLCPKCLCFLSMKLTLKSSTTITTSLHLSCMRCHNHIFPRRPWQIHLWHRTDSSYWCGCGRVLPFFQKLLLIFVKEKGCIATNLKHSRRGSLLWFSDASIASTAPLRRNIGR